MKLNSTIKTYSFDYNTGIGLFTYNDKTGIIKNLKVILDCETTIQAGHYASVGIIAGVNYGTIQNCMVDGKIIYELTGYAGNLGGIAGDTWGNIENCVSNVNLTLSAGVESDVRLGGCIGAISYQANSVTGVSIPCTIKNVYNSGNITIDLLDDTTGVVRVGGISGFILGGCTLKYGYNIGKIIDKTKTSTKVNIDTASLTVAGETISNIYSMNNLISSNNTNTKTSNHATIISESELKGQAGVTILNEDNDEQVWVEDKDNINNGYPILNWQAKN